MPHTERAHNTNNNQIDHKRNSNFYLFIFLYECYESFEQQKEYKIRRAKSQYTKDTNIKQYKMIRSVGQADE